MRRSERNPSCPAAALNEFLLSNQCKGFPPSTARKCTISMANDKLAVEVVNGFSAAKKIRDAAANSPSAAHIPFIKKVINRGVNNGTELVESVCHTASRVSSFTAFRMRTPFR